MASSLLMALLIVATGSWTRAATSKARDSSNLSENKLQSIVRTKSQSELKSLLGRHDEMERAQKECEQQLEAKRIPTSCFQVLADKSKSSAANTKWLEQICIRRANETRDLGTLR